MKCYSNRENNSLYWLESHLNTPVRSLAPPTGDLSNQRWGMSENVIRTIAYRIRLARAILENTLEREAL